MDYKLTDKNGQTKDGNKLLIGTFDIKRKGII